MELLITMGVDHAGWNSSPFSKNPTVSFPLRQDANLGLNSAEQCHWPFLPGAPIYTHNSDVMFPIVF